MALNKTKIMQAQFVDIAHFPKLTGKSTKETFHNSDHYHVWVHIDEPGKKGPMHRHSADEIFYCVQGQCTFHFPNGESQALNPGMLVTIPKGQLYQLHNTGKETMILLGSRGESAGEPRHTATNDVIKNVDGQYVVEKQS
jgi:mannose-6-phosphate isomerase-like protein (cupin superfamily)